MVSDSSDYETNLVREKGAEITTTLFGVFRTLKMFSLDNKNSQTVIAKLQEMLRQFFTVADTVSWQLTGNQFFINGIKVVIGNAGYDTFVKFGDELAARQVGGITLYSGMTNEELYRFVKYFSDFKVSPEFAKEPYEEFRPGFDALDISTIDVKPMITEDELASAEDSMDDSETGTYLKTIYIVYRLFQSVKNGGKVNLTNAKKAIQKLVGVIEKAPEGIVTLLRVEELDNYLIEHSVNVCVYSILIAQKLGLPRNKTADVATCGLFHDLGMLRVPEEITLTPGPLSREQWEYIWVHPSEGAKMLLGSDRLVEVVTRAMQVAFQHQMREDQMGYPQVSGDQELNLYTRIVKVADGFDSMTSDRPHRPAMSEEQAFAELMSQTETAYERTFIKLLANAMGVFPIGAKVKLNTGELAVVTQANDDPDYRDKPQVRVYADAQGRKIDKALDLMEMDGMVFKYWIEPFDEKELDLDVSDFISIM